MRSQEQHEPGQDADRASGKPTPSQARQSPASTSDEPAAGASDIAQDDAANETLDPLDETTNEREAPGLFVRLPWIIFQGLTIGLPLAGLVIFATWILRLSGVAIPWPPAVGLALGALSGMISLAAFQTLEHDARQTTEPDEEGEEDPEAIAGSRRKPPPSTLARITAGTILGNLMGVPIVVAVLLIGAAIGYFWLGMPRAMTATVIVAGALYYIALAMGIASGMKR